MKKTSKKHIKFGLITALTSGLVCQGGLQSATAGSSWFSKKRQEQATQKSSTRTLKAQAMSPAPMASGDIGTTVFDLVISLYNSPSGDDNPNNNTGSEGQTAYEEIIRFWADAVYEQSNGGFKLGKVRIFRNGIYGSLADVVWKQFPPGGDGCHGPCANPSGFGVSGQNILMVDNFGNVNFLDPSRQEDGGYTLAHELGHYILGVYDEYRPNKDNVTSPYIHMPVSSDTPVDLSIMNSQWNAVTWNGNDFRWLNHSTSNNYQSNTAQGRCYGASGWDVITRPVGDDPKDGARLTLAQRVHYTALDAVKPTAADNWMRLELPGQRDTARSALEIVWMNDKIEMQIVLDRSGSMTGDPFTNAKEAAKTLIDSTGGNTSVGLVSFSNTAVQDKVVGTAKNEIKAIIDELNTDGCTAMFDAAKLSLDNLGASNATKLVFLLGDGVDNQSLLRASCSSCSDTNQCPDVCFTSPDICTDCQNCQSTIINNAYLNKGVPLSTFAYGSFAPDGVLRKMAETTGGVFRVSPQSLAELQSAFLAAKAALTPSAGILQDSISVPPNSSIDFPFAVDSTLKNFSVFATYVGSDGDVAFTLNGPNSSADFTCKKIADSVSCSAMVAGAAVHTGAWTLAAANNSNDHADVHVNIIADPYSDGQHERPFALVVAPIGGKQVTYPSPVLLTAVPSQGLPITGVNITATVTDPDGIVIPLTMTDDGQNGDGLAGDGTYSAILNYTKNGNYLVKVTVDNAQQTAQFTTKGYLPSSSATEDGTTPPSPVFPAITENFTRTASVQLSVSGVVADDYPNSAPGKVVDPDNSDIPGRIETAGDKDVFTVDTAGHEYLTFRVTGLTLGMEPRLRILQQDGATEIFAATIDQLAVKSPYLALNIPVNGNAQLHAKVSHKNSGTGSYMFSVGKAIISDPHPVANAGSDQTVECTSPKGTIVRLDGTGSYDAKGAPPVNYLWTGSFGTKSGATPVLELPLGGETATLVVNDGQLDSEPDTVDIKVQDTTAPVIQKIAASPNILWPPNHKLVQVAVVPTAKDVCDSSPPVCSITDVVSNESGNSDWEITGNLSVKLRSERSGKGTGRRYAIKVKCVDASGNASTGEVTVDVPHDKGKGKK